MDYQNFAQIRESPIEYSIKIGGRSGDMGNAAIANKFEHSDEAWDPADYYRDYSHNILKDRRPDEVLFAAEEPRKSQTIHNWGALNLHLYGSRSGEEVPSHPEMFLGETDPDPRGTSTDPDFKKQREQQEARTRFVRWYPDADNSITGGGWHPNKAAYDARIQTQLQTAPRLKVFSTQYDGRREGLRRVSATAETPLRVVNDEARYGELITDWAANPQRTNTIISNDIIRNSRMYQQNTTDHEFQTAWYGDNPRHQKLGPVANAVLVNRTGHKWNDEDPTQVRRAAGLIMGEVVMRQVAHDTDAQESSGNEAAMRRQGPLGVNAAAGPYSYVNDSRFGNSDMTQMAKSLLPQMATNIYVNITPDAEKPANGQFEGMLSNRKSLIPSEDVDIIRRSIVRDARNPHLQENFAAKSGRTKGPSILPGAALPTHIEVEGYSMETYKYRTPAPNAAGLTPNVQNAAQDGRFAQSLNTARGQTPIGAPKGTTTRSVNPDFGRQFQDNHYKERLGGKMGTKYTMPHITRETTETGERMLAT